MSKQNARRRSVTRKISDLLIKCYVRAKLDEEWVMHLAELIQNKVSLPPILITRDNVVIDGRHRVEAHQLNDLKEIVCEIVDITDEINLISQAFKENTGGALPSKPKDIEHVVSMLLERNVPMKDISNLLGLPTNLVRRYCKDVKSRIARAKMQRARDAVSSGMTSPRAAEEFGVDLETLRAHISGSRRRKQNLAMEIKTGLTKTYRGLGQKNANACRKVVEQYQDGDITEKQVIAVFNQIDGLIRRSHQSVEGWRARFLTITNGGITPKG
jgi:ParB-like chromosome segregation protein Spo0J